MSIRVLGLLTTTAAVSLTLTAGIAAASASMTAPSAPSDRLVSDQAPIEAPPPAPADDTPPANAAASPAAADAADDADDAALKECADAECEVKVRNGQTIKLDEKYGVDPIHLKIDGTRVTFTIRSENSKMTSTVDAGWGTGTSATYNNITLSPRMNKDGSMTLKVSHS